MDSETREPAPASAPGGVATFVGDAADPAAVPHYCGLPPVPERELEPGLDPGRMRAILMNDNKWVNRTVLHYYFFDHDEDGQRVFLSDGTNRWESWVGPEDQRDVVRAAFDEWKESGIGLEFVDVDDRAEAELRIGFMQGDGSWSYLGTDALRIGGGQRTMNFGWRLTGQPGLDTALHEVGHAIGLPHEHQNPYAGIVWNDEAVYAALAAPPNNWDRDKTHYNIIRKIPPDQVQGSSWDPNSVMHYPFRAGLIREPAPFAAGLFPMPGLSDRDRAWSRVFYPPAEETRIRELGIRRTESLPTESGAQADFRIVAPATRRYRIATFGEADTLLVLFEEVDGELRYRAADDDSGFDRNAHLRVRLRKNRSYVLRARIKYSGGPFAPVVMIW
jgi:hypothetical protein